MSQQVFPSLPGVDIAIGRTQSHATLIQTSASGKEQRASLRSGRPCYTYTLRYNFLRQDGFSTNVLDELRTLSKFMNDMKGRFDSFLFICPVESSVRDQVIGVGDASTVAFQLSDSLGNPIHDVNGSASIYVAGALKSLGPDYTISSKGLVTFVNPPANLSAVTWSGAYYRRCRFEADEMELERLAALVWTGDAIKLVTVL